ncbi:hypothetical protein D0Z07_2591 [Hyphodiscus hymeniophilus]|uniref:Transglycosylase SLT domain-containing protein n=1 Tax=Hyphodiscus hymeniophilus TaxID=353542 RepID=A0A9P6VNA8_9HELO|nr:hypothetical protein D0Z07_2591 [Hyphodiscus hymeniophilus]
MLAAFCQLARGHPITTQASDAAVLPPYQLYTGDGTVQQGWPGTNQWVSFDAMWDNNQELMISSCTQYNQANNQPQELVDLHDTVRSIAASSGVDERFILAIILQESGGCLRAPTSYLGVTNPGLMQDHNGFGTCFGANTCSAEAIRLMVSDGVIGTYDGYNPQGMGGAGDGLKQCIAQAENGGARDATAIYRAARIYNTGSYHLGEDLSAPKVATLCYASDIANRLTGFHGLESGCRLQR